MKIANKRDRIRYKLKRTSVLYRISIHKTNQYFSAQAIEIATGNVIASIHQKTFTSGKGKKPVETIEAMGESFGKALADKKLEDIAFDRSGYIYHGKVKAFAEGLRKAGLKF
ncbi:MAG: 50S ribosomal protein L18 [Candidatus Dojkabacteria bacterium]|nr:MAG: 50S ribosomal protein L18 [Candidatus Dojkabacteria bacterium]